jgi:hypothetical protein
MRALAALAAALVLAPAASAAEPIGIRHDRHAVDVALAGPEVLVLSEPALGHDDFRLVALPRTGGKARTLLHLEDTSFGANAVDASAQRVAVIVEMDSRDEETRVYSGPPSGPLTIVRRSRGRFDGKTFVPSGLSVDGDRTLLVESTETISFGDEETRDEIRASILDASGWHPIPWASATRRPVHLAGPYVSVVAADPHRIEVVELATGAIVATVTPGEGDTYAVPTDLRADGQVAVASLRGVDVAGPGLPQRNLPNSGRLGGAFFAADTFVAYDDAHDTLNLFAPDSAHAPLGPASRGEHKSVSADGDGVAWLFNGCVRYASLRAPAAAATPDRCPGTEISLYLLGASSKLRGNHARVPLQCVAARDGRCRGTFFLRRSRRSPVVARGRFDVPVSPRYQYAKVYFTRAAVAEIRRDGDGHFLVNAHVDDGTVSSFAPYESEFDVDT